MMYAVIDTARGLFDTDGNGMPVNLETVHPEYVRAVVELVARLDSFGESSHDADDDYDRVADMLGLPRREDVRA